ncbi:MAG: hypothetical protein DMG07_10355, partial [Acidobacteria bacterium]
MLVKPPSRAGGAHFGQRLDTIQDALDQVRAPGRIARDEHARGQDVLGLKTELDAEEVTKCPQEQARADQEHHGERHLAGDERGTEALLNATVARAPAVLPEGRLQVEARGLPGRRQPEDERGEERERRGESENARVETRVHHLSERHG